MKTFALVFDTRLGRIAAILMLAGSFVVAVVPSWNYWDLVNNGVGTTGRLLRAEVRDTRGSWLFGPEYTVHYAFIDAGGSERRASQIVDKEMFDAWSPRPPGAAVDVRYSPGRPFNSAISMRLLHSELIYWWWIAASVWGAVALAMMLVARRATRSGAGAAT